MFKKYWAMWPWYPPSVYAQHFLNFWKRMIKKKPVLCEYIQNILSHMTTECQIGTFWECLGYILRLCNHTLPECSKKMSLECDHKVLSLGNENTCWVLVECAECIQYFQIYPLSFSTFNKYSACVFHFPDSVLCDHILETFSLSHSGKVWLHNLSIS